MHALRHISIEFLGDLESIGKPIISIVRLAGWEGGRGGLSWGKSSISQHKVCANVKKKEGSKAQIHSPLT